VAFPLRASCVIRHPHLVQPLLQNPTCNLSNAPEIIMLILFLCQSANRCTAVPCPIFLKQGRWASAGSCNRTPVSYLVRFGQCLVLFQKKPNSARHNQSALNVLLYDIPCHPLSSVFSTPSHPSNSL